MKFSFNYPSSSASPASPPAEPHGWGSGIRECLWITFPENPEKASKKFSLFVDESMQGCQVLPDENTQNGTTEAGINPAKNESGGFSFKSLSKKKQAQTRNENNRVVIQVPVENANGTSALPPALIDPLSHPDAEFELCGWLLRTKKEDIETVRHILDRLPDADISQPHHKNIVLCARHLLEHNQVCGATMVLDYADKNQWDVGGAEHLASLLTDPICAQADIARIEQDIDIIIDFARRRAVRRMLTERLNDLNSKAYTDIVSALADDVATLQAQTDAATRQDPRHVSEFMAEVIQEATGEASQASTMATGFTELDKQLNGGVRDGDLVLVGARPGMGKTAFAFGLGRNMSLDSSHTRPVLAFSLEMPGKAQAARLLSAESAVPARILRTAGEVMKHDHYIDLINQVIPRFNRPDVEGGADGNNPNDPRARLWIDDTPGLSLAQIRSRARQFVRQYGVRPIIIVDYLQIVTQNQSTDNKYTNHVQAIGMISQGLKSLARELDTPVIALSQLNRSLEQRTNKQPILSDLRESGNLEQDADIILFLHRDVIYNPDTPNPHEAMVIVAKQREGEVGPVTLGFNNTLVRFENLA